MVKDAKNNIIIQLRKVITLRGQKPVEFANGKKEKVHPMLQRQHYQCIKNLDELMKKMHFNKRYKR